MLLKPTPTPRPNIGDLIPDPGPFPELHLDVWIVGITAIVILFFVFRAIFRHTGIVEDAEDAAAAAGWYPPTWIIKLILVASFLGVLYWVFHDDKSSSPINKPEPTATVDPWKHYDKTYKERYGNENGNRR